MDGQDKPQWKLWMALGFVLAGFGGIPLLAGTADAVPNGEFRALAKLVVGAVVIAYATWLRTRAVRR